MSTPAPQSDPMALQTLKRHEALQNARIPYESQWDEIQKLVRVHAKALYEAQEGNRRFDGIFDSTAVECLEQLASGVHSYLTNPAERWFEINVQRPYELENDSQALAWLEAVSDIVFETYALNGTNFNQALHEGYLDLGAFGHCIINQEADPDTYLVFRTMPVVDCYVAEDSRGRIDTMHREIKWTGRQVLQEFGEEKTPAIFMKPEHLDKEFTMVHAVFPREDRNVLKIDKLNKPWASLWISKDFKCVVDQGGYDTFPYHVPRWFKLTNERYGRSPAMKCLPDIRMLNRMEITTLRAGQKAVDPALVVSDDGFMLPIATSPGAIIFKDPMAPEIQVLESKANLPWAEEKCAQKREMIKTAFHTDWLRMEKENKEMTAFEVQDRRDEKLRLMSPMLGRLEAELLGPMLARSYALCAARNLFPRAPQSLRGRKLKVGYTSPASKAQSGSKAVGIGRIINDIAPLAQLDPGVMDAINMDAAVQELAIARGTTRKIIRSPDEIMTLRASRKQQQQAQAMAGMMEPASKAMLNMAKAKQAGGGIGA